MLRFSASSGDVLALRKGRSEFSALTGQRHVRLPYKPEAPASEHFAAHSLAGALAFRACILNDYPEHGAVPLSTMLSVSKREPHCCHDVVSLPNKNSGAFGRIRDCLFKKIENTVRDVSLSEQHELYGKTQ